ncbi:MAG TPA: tripartite tricarboxylate transporter TctB family protein [Hyphomicrobiaceae bacterium]|nr:tripartite tricarboxylate transporter TctB family protein [Hyphomicrobiaceae bacterium]
MEFRAARGELLLALVFAATGILWVLVALGLPLWQGFAPDSGFLPLIYGALLTGLSLVIVADLVLAGPAGSAQESGLRKPLLVLLALAVTVAGLEVVGFSASIFLLLMFLYAVIERLPILSAGVVSVAVTAGLYVVFRTWLSVPLPRGVIGF